MSPLGPMSRIGPMVPTGYNGLNGRMARWAGRQAEQRMGRLADGRTKGQADRQMDRQTERQTDIPTYINYVRFFMYVKLHCLTLHRIT